MTVADRKRHKHTQHQSTERRKHTQAKLCTLTPIFFALSSLNQTKCAAFFSRIFIYLCFLLLKSHFYLEEEKTTWHHFDTESHRFFSFFSLWFKQFSMVIHCHRKRTTMNYNKRNNWVARQRHRWIYCTFFIFLATVLTSVRLNTEKHKLEPNWTQNKNNCEFTTWTLNGTK